MIHGFPNAGWGGRGWPGLGAVGPFVPGHLLERQDNGIISGDVLFNFGVGNCKNGGDVAMLFQTIQELNELLPDGCILYPGHDYMETNLGFAMTNGVEKASAFMSQFEEWAGKNTTMGLEREINPFLRVDTLEEFSVLRALLDEF